MGRIGRAWGNALGGWRLQGRGPRGRWLPKGIRHAHKIGKMSQYRRTYRGAGSVGMKEGAAQSAIYAINAMNAARRKGYFINPEIGLSGVGVSAGYGQKISPKLRASVSIKFAVQRTDGGPIVAAGNQIIDNSLGGYPGLRSLVKYGVVDTGVDNTVIVRDGTTLRVKSGRKANIARNKNPAYRNQGPSKPYRAERRGKKVTAQNIGNGHKVVKPQKYDRVKHNNDFGGYVTYKQRPGVSSKTKTKKKHKSKQVASTISR